MKTNNQSASGALRAIAYILACLMILALLSFLLYFFVLSGEKPRSDVSPDYAVNQVDIFSAEPLPAPTAFLNDSARGMVGSVQYLVFPKKNVGEQNVAILMHLEDGTTRTENAVLSIHDSVATWEMGTEATPESLLGEQFAGAEFVPALSEFTELGTYDVEIVMDGRTLPFTLNVQDTTAPAVTVNSPVNYQLHETVKAEDFVKSYEDVSDVEFHLSSIPDTNDNSSGVLQLVAVDSAGNSATYDVDYAVTGDGTAPEIKGVKDMQTLSYVNISYLHDVTAEDDTDGEVEVTAELPEDFSIKKPGEYTVTYTAKDAAGNVAEKTAKLSVLTTDDVDKLTEEDVMRMGYFINDSLLAVEEGEEPLTEKEKARKIFFQVQNHIKYKDNKDDLPWHINAALVLQRGYGDCRNYFAYAKLLYTCAGFENMMVEHTPSSPTAAKHFWNLVKIDGEWWHCDSTPRVNTEMIFFMKTDAQMDAYSKKENGCFERDRSLYPKTPE